MESGIWGFEIRKSAQGIRNPTYDLISESNKGPLTKNVESGTWNLESRIFCMESRIQDYLVLLYME